MSERRDDDIAGLKTHQIFDDIYEVGIDEAGRGPLFGPVYAAAVILPKDDENFDYSQIKDSKMFTSRNKRKKVADYIKDNALAWGIGFRDSKFIDTYNIRQATFYSMHDAITMAKCKTSITNNFRLLVDGNDFKPYMYFNSLTNNLEKVPFECFVKGDKNYYSIAAASILAKTAHDDFIDDLCEKYENLNEKYSLLKNKGYGTKDHMEGIKTHGITEWHRASFSPCNEYVNQS